jgi:hypothetical protein
MVYPWYRLAPVALALGCQSFLVEGGESGGEADAGDPVTSVSPDAGVTTSSCSFAPGRTTGPKVRVIYLVPSDRQEDPRYVANLELAVRDVQLWLREHMPDGSSIQVHDPVVEVVPTPQPAAYYSPAFWDNVTSDGLQLTGGIFDDPDNLWLFYIAADAACGQGGGAADGVGIFTENDLRGLVDVTRVPSCDGEQPDLYDRCRWVGGMALHLTRALGLPVPPGCIDDDAGTPCDWAQLTATGYLDYPNARLTEDDVAYLSATSFFSPTSDPGCSLDCSALAN